MVAKMNKEVDKNKKNFPTKEQLKVMMQRYSSVQLIPIDIDKKPTVVSSDTANFKKPIFFGAECGKTLDKVMMALKEQAFYEPSDPNSGSRVIMEGNLELIDKAMISHAKAKGDDPYNPKKPFDHHLHLMQGMNIPEHEYLRKLSEDD